MAYIPGFTLIFSDMPQRAQIEQHAQDFEDLWRLDVEQLAEVSSASKRAESLNQTPGLF